MTLPQVFTLITAVAAVGTAIFTAKAAHAAEEGADATEDAVRGQLLARLSADFWEDDFRRSCRLLGDLRERWSNFGNAAYAYAKAFARFRDAQPPPKGDGDSLAESIDRDDRARRRVKGYYYRVYRFVKADLLERQEVRELLTSRYNVELFLAVVEPLEKELSEVLGHRGYEREREVFTFYDQLYSEELERPLRDFDSHS